ncbi:hypothetical protein V1463_01310 [Micrococcus yunnanensis]|uniref:hypothetical protein n=1 Tax=Micrococcus yunnanensis TaxID=566027 RepID=UPI00300E388F
MNVKDSPPGAERLDPHGELVIGFIAPSAADGVDHHFELYGTDRFSVEDLRWVEDFAARLRLAESFDAFRMADEAWRSLRSLVDVVAEVPVPRDGGKFAWSHEVQVRRFFSLVSNFLASARTYIEAADAVLSRSFGKESRERRAFSLDVSETFDASPAYQICYYLRNILVHTGTMPGRLSFSSQSNSSRAEVKYVIDRSTLLNLYDWKRIVRDSIRSLSDEIDLLQLMQDHWTAIHRLEEARCRRQIGDLVEDIPKYRAIFHEIGIPEGGVPIIARLNNVGHDETTVAHRVIPHESLLDALEIAHEEGDVVAAARDLTVQDPAESGAPRGDDSDSARRLDEARSLALNFMVYGPEALQIGVRSIVLAGPSRAEQMVVGLVEQCALLTGMVHQVTGIPPTDALGMPEGK